MKDELKRYIMTTPKTTIDVYVGFNHSHVMVFNSEDEAIKWAMDQDIKLERSQIDKY